MLKLLGTGEDKMAKIRELIEAREFGEDLLEEVGGVLHDNGTKGPQPKPRRKKRPAPKPRRSRPRARRDQGDPPVGCG